MPRTPNRDTGQEILNAARTLFIRFGYKKTTVDEIAALARVGKPTIYSRFQSKDGVYLAMVTREAEGIRARVARAAARERDVIRKAERMLDASMKAVKENPIIQRLLELDPDLVAAHMRPVAERIEEEALGMIEEVLEQGIREGRIRKLDTRLAAYTLYKIYQSYTYAGTLRPREKSPEKIRRFITDFVKHGLLKP